MPSPKARVVLAFAAVYLIWGSTYLAIRFGIETIPPFFMAAARFLIAGAILYALARAGGAPRPEPHRWWSAAIVGGLLLLVGNGSVVWAEQRVASGLTALLVATEPLWVVLIDWARRGGAHPSGSVIAGLVTGFVGVVLLVDPANLAGGTRVDLVGAGVLIAASAAWAAGSLYSARAQASSSPVVATGMNMLAGGTFLLLASMLTGEPARVDLAAVSLRSALAWGYLTVFGAVIAFTAYIWILRHQPPARAATYAYVNPVIAVFLGWALGGEALAGRTLLAAVVIVAAVLLITTARSRSVERLLAGLRRGAGRALAPAPEAGTGVAPQNEICSNPGGD